MGENVQNFLWGYLALINIVGFILMIYDKYKAKRKGWRVPELRFFIIGFLGGAVGVYLGMRIVRHKTKHALFVYGIPILILLNFGLLTYLGLYN